MKAWVETVGTTKTSYGQTSDSGSVFQRVGGTCHSLIPLTPFSNLVGLGTEGVDTLPQLS